MTQQVITDFAQNIAIIALSIGVILNTLRGR